MSDADQYERWLGDPSGSTLPPLPPVRRQGRAGEAATDDKEGGEEDKEPTAVAKEAVLQRLLDLLVTTQLNLTMTVLAQGQHMHAIALCTSVIRLRPQEAKAFYRRGLAALQMGEDYEAAVSDLVKARDLAPRDGLIASKLAEARRLLKTEQARESRAYAAFFRSSPDEEGDAAGGGRG